MSTVIVWFRNDLRIHDLPMLAAAAQADHVVPVFILSEALLSGPNASSNRNRFLLESLQDLKASLQARGSTLHIRQGDAAEELTKLAQETGASAVHYTIDYTPVSITRDQAVHQTLANRAVEVRGFPGKLAIDSLQGITTKQGKVVNVFTPFWRQWQQIARRETCAAPAQLPPAPAGLKTGELPDLAALQTTTKLAPHAQAGGETAGRARLQHWLEQGIDNYVAAQDDLAADATSKLSAYLHFGCLSVREIETLLPAGQGAEAFHRQLAWRDFYHYILLNYPTNPNQELQARYRNLHWDDNQELLRAWQQGKTGYPIVDAAMRQLNQEGWMHNRARLIVGSFLTKDLLLDWRAGQRYFAQQLLDGDTACNNGNWQWIASVGVDPAPVFRRLYNPSLQQKKHDPIGAYIRKYVPELREVDNAYLAEPWTMPEAAQRAANCVIGRDYPGPIVDHAVQRKLALERYRQTAP